MLLTMLSLPDDWIYYKAHFKSIWGDSERTYLRGIKELEAKGYLSRYQERDGSGFGAMIYEVGQDPLFEPIEPVAQIERAQIESAQKERTITNTYKKQTLIKNNNTHTAENDQEDLKRILSQKELEAIEELAPDKRGVFIDWILYLDENKPLKALQITSLLKHFQDFTPCELSEQTQTAAAGGFTLLKEKPSPAKIKAKDYKAKTQDSPIKSETESQRSGELQRKASESEQLGRALSHRAQGSPF